MLHLPSEGGYENPLYEQWLSAYDVKHYHLTLAVSNTDTQIEGVAEVVVEATRDLDTLVLELQNSLDVTNIMFTDDIEVGDGKVYYRDGVLMYEWSLTNSNPIRYKISYNKKGELVETKYYDDKGDLIERINHRKK